MGDDKDPSIALMQTVAALAKAVVNISAGTTSTVQDELNFISAVYPDLKNTVNTVKNRVLGLVQKAVAISRSTAESETLDIKDILEYSPLVGDTLDNLLEFIDTHLDEFYGRAPAVKVKINEGRVGAGQKRRAFMTEQDPNKIIRLIDHNVYIPEKHPYEEEVKSLYRRTEDIPVFTKEFSYTDNMDSTPFEWVETLEALTRMAIDLEQESCIAVDLENHSFHSYYGFLCLMQVSSEKKDYIVDVIALREHIGPALRQIFADSRILKVFHGAQSDIQWLQRDFNIYIVNMFDTGTASKALGLGSYSLAFLLSTYVGVVSDKKYQLADWRTRPLSREMLLYARMDTHYLLYIFQHLERALLEKGGEQLLLSVYKSSTSSTLALYRPEIFDSSGWRSIIGRSSVPYSEREVSIIKAVYKWREEVAVEEDESPPAILPNYMILRLAQGSLADPEVILRAAKHPLTAALKHVDSLKTVLSYRGALPSKAVNVPQGPTHTRFPDSSSDDDKVVRMRESGEAEALDKLGEVRESSETKAETFGGPTEIVAFKESTDTMVSASPAVVTVQVMGHNVARRPRISFATNATKTSSMFSALSDPDRDKASVKVDNKNCAKYDSVVESMSITKVCHAGQLLAAQQPTVEPPQATNTEEAAEGEESKFTKDDNEVMILRSGQKFDSEEFISSKNANVVLAGTERICLASDSRGQKVGALARPPSAMQIDLEDATEKLFFDAKPQEPAKAWETKAPSSSSKSGPVKRPPRLGSAPRSGNRSMNFTK